MEEMHRARFVGRVFEFSTFPHFHVFVNQEVHQLLLFQSFCSVLFVAALAFPSLEVIGCI